MVGVGLGVMVGVGVGVMVGVGLGVRVRAARLRASLEALHGSLAHLVREMKGDEGR